jgi:Synergist-CTERM protein sorting domain-containing protein
VAGIASVDCNVNVANAVTPVSRVFLDKSQINLTINSSNIGEIALLKGTITQPNATPYYNDLKWTSSNTGFVTVDNGIVRAIAPGTATITFEEIPGYLPATCVVNVYSETTGIVKTVNNVASIGLMEGTPGFVEVTVLPTGSYPAQIVANPNVIWSSSNPTAAYVGENPSNTGNYREGTIFGAGPGSAVITATTIDGKYSVSWDVTVTRDGTSLPTPVTSVSLSDTVMSMNIGDTKSLNSTISPTTATNRYVSWSVDNPNVVRLSIIGSSQANIIAVGQGTAIITAMTNGGDGPSATCIVYVGTYVPVSGVSFRQSSLDIVAGGTGSPLYRITPDNASDKRVTWSTNNPSVATVHTDGVVTGVAAGSADITITTVDGGFTDICRVTVYTAPTAPVIITETANLPVGTVGVSFDEIIIATGTVPLSWDIATGALPAGLSLNASTGVISGTPTTAGASNFRIRVTNAAGADSKDLTIYINTVTPTAPTITSANNTTVTNGTNSSFQVTATGTMPITFGLSGTVPTGVSIGSTNGLMGILGTVAAGTYNFSITAANGVSPNASQDFTLTVNAAPVPPTITTTSLPNGTVGIAYNQTLTASGDTPISWDITAGTLPAGLTLSSAGVITGTPSAPGSSDFTVRATNGAGNNTRVLSIDIIPGVAGTPPTITTVSLPNGTVGTAYSQTLTATGDTPMSWDITVGTLPAGLTLSSAGVITGTPSAPGSSDFTVRASNATGNDTKPLSIIVNSVATVPVTGVSLSQNSATIEIGKTVQLNHTVTPSNATNPAVTWSSSNNSVATVVNGLVTGLTVGTTTITVMSVENNNIKDTCLVTVKDPITQVDTTFPSDKNDVSAKTGLNADDFEEKDGKVWLKKKIAESIAKDLLVTDEVEVNILPVFEGIVVPPGSVAEVSFTIKGKDLLALYPDEINLIGLIFGGGGKLFDYADKTADFGDGKFTLLFENAIYNGEIRANEYYTIVAYIKDGGIFDLDGVANGKIISSIFLAKKKSGSGGCNAAGFGYITFALIPFALRKKSK